MDEPAANGTALPCGRRVHSSDLALPDEIALTPDDEKALELKRELVGDQERVPPPFFLTTVSAKIPNISKKAGDWVSALRLHVFVQEVGHGLPRRRVRCGINH